MERVYSTDQTPKHAREAIKRLIDRPIRMSDEARAMLDASLRKAAGLDGRCRYGYGVGGDCRGCKNLITEGSDVGSQETGTCEKETRSDAT